MQVGQFGEHVKEADKGTDTRWQGIVVWWGIIQGRGIVWDRDSGRTSNELQNSQSLYSSPLN